MMAKRRPTLEERIVKRDPTWITTTLFAKGHLTYHVRAELRRVSRKVRGLEMNSNKPEWPAGVRSYNMALDDVLAVLKEAMK